MQPGCRFLGFALAIPLPGQTFVVVVDRHRHHLFGRVLADHLLIQEALDVLRPWNGGQGRGRLAALAGGWCGFPARLMAVAWVALTIHQLFIQDLVAEIDAFVADVDAWSGDQLAHLVLGFPTERTFQMGVELGHRTLGTTQGTIQESTDGISLNSQDRERKAVCQPSVMIPSSPELSTTRSIRPYSTASAGERK